MWIKVKSGLVNLDKIAKVEIAEWDDEDGTVVRVEAIEAGGDAIFCLYHGRDREKAEAVLAEVEQALLREGKLWVLPVQYRE